MKLVLLDASTLGDANIDIFKEFGEFESYNATSPEFTCKRLESATVAITNKVVIDKDVIDKCPNLKLICVTATGTNNIDLDYASKKGIVVKNVAGYSTKSVAQHTITLALSLIGHVRYYDDFSKNEWAKSKIFTNLERPFFEISGKIWGIIGLGSIGREVAKIADAFGAEVCYCSTSGRNATDDYKRLELNELLQTCDIVSIHAPLNENTKNLLDEKELKAMKKDAVLINVGRGGIVNEEALAKALDDKKIYAGFDVTEVEPIPKNNPLLNVTCKDRFILTPHIAWASKEARETLLTKVVNNIKEYIGE